MISLDDSKTPRARMPCGHVISTESMIGFLNMVLEKQQCVIRCPARKPDATNCDAEWSFTLCKKVGVMTKEERNFFEEKFANLKERTYLFTQECRKCKSHLFREEGMRNRVICPHC